MNPQTGSAPTDAEVQDVPAEHPFNESSARSREEFGALYTAHFDLVWRALRRFGVREADVMDLTQKVFVTAFRKLDTFEGRSLVRTWLFSICQRVASDYRRSAVVRREIATDVSELEMHASAPEDAASALSSRRQLALAESVLDKLSAEQRTVFVMFELEDLSGAEIAQVLEVSLGTVRSRLRLAREVFAREVQRLNASGLTDVEAR